MRTAMAAALLVGLVPVGVRAADDDLTVVKRAVQNPDRVRGAGARSEARWFRVRIEEHDGGKVKLNLPLPFVRALGSQTDAWPGGMRCGAAGHHCPRKLSEVLGALDAGEEFVSIEGDDARIRIWID
jgi:hypothetical protein